MNSSVPLLSEVNNYSVSIRQCNEENIEYRQNILLLQDMGYNIRIIEALYSIYIINSIEQAIQYLTVENGLWQHNYIEIDKQCIICKEDTDHLDYISINGNKIKEKIIQEKEELSDKISQRSNSLLNKNWSFVSDKPINYTSNISNSFSNNEKKRKEDTEDTQDIFKKNENRFNIINLEACLICDEEYEDHQFFKNNKCNHTFCIICWKNYLKFHILEGKITLECMQNDCKMEIEEEKVIDLVDINFYNKLKKNKINKIVSISKNLKFCPIVNCEGYAEKKDNKNVICNNGGHKFCFNCLLEWHDKKSCAEVLDKEFLKWKEGKVVKRCPNCKFWTEKNDGCNHMTCLNCNHSWCWLCTGNYFAGHYGRFGPCEGHQFANNPILRSRFSRNMRLIFLITKAILKYFFIVLGILCFGTSILAIIIQLSLRTSSNKFVKVFNSVSIFTLGIVYHPFFLSISLLLLTIAMILFIVLFPYVLLIYLKQKRFL